MSDDISFDVAPGYLLAPTQMNLVLSERVTGLQYSLNGPTPSISKYIAYDTSTPPSPFIAVTQDGKGNVVYDGGFPKFYNQHAPSANVTTFNQLTGSFKYLYNALRFIENKAKRATGNNKVLLLGDADTNYRVDSDEHIHYFKTSFTRLSEIAGYDLTIKTSANYPGGQIDCNLNELEQYCCVIMLSSQFHDSSVRYITENAIDAMVTYRENGSGLAIITDHGPALNSLEEATGVYGGAFFTTANRIATRFGAWFSADYNRLNLNVGHLRNTYGDHPLYNQIPDTDDLVGGASESRVFVEPFTPILPSQVPPFTIGEGRTLVQVAAALDTGEIVTASADYSVVDVKVSITDGTVVRDNGQSLELGLRNRSVIDVVLDSGDMEVFAGAVGVVSINGVRVGEVTYSEVQGTRFIWDNHDGSALHFANGDKVKVDFASLDLSSTVTISRFQPPIQGQLSLAVVCSLLRSYKPTLTDIDRVKDLVQGIGDIVPWQRQDYSQNIPQNLDFLVKYFTDAPDFLYNELSYIEGLANHWELTGSSIPKVGSVPGVLSGDANFTSIDGVAALHLVNGRFELPAFTVLGKGPWTISLWYRPESFTSYTHLLTSAISQNTFTLKIAIASYLYGDIVYIYTLDSKHVFSETSVALGEWSMFTFSYDSTTARVYLNGRLSGSREVELDIPETGFVVGQGHGEERSHGYQRDLMHWGRALTDSEVRNLYLNTSGHIRGGSA